MRITRILSTTKLATCPRCSTEPDRETGRWEASPAVAAAGVPATPEAVPVTVVAAATVVVVVVVVEVLCTHLKKNMIYIRLYTAVMKLKYTNVGK